MSNGPRTASWATSYIDKDIKVNVREFIYNVASPLTQAHVRVGAQYALDISVVPLECATKKHNTTQHKSVVSMWYKPPLLLLVSHICLLHQVLVQDFNDTMSDAAKARWWQAHANSKLRRRQTADTSGAERVNGRLVGNLHPLHKQR